MSVGCRDLEVAIGCSSNGTVFVPVNIHYEYRTAASGATIIHATRYTNADGTVYVPPAGYTVTNGACPQARTRDRTICVRMTNNEVWNVIESTQLVGTTVISTQYLDPDTSPMTNVTALVATILPLSDCNCCP